ncbi:MAG: LamG domain-containing protein [Lewinellaceae bacterium]|nr:LamG domain-containing protein [Lewinellaceae bacterium]
MKNIHKSRLLALLLLTLGSLPMLFGQNQSQTPDPGCFPASSGTIVPSAAYFNYGNSNKMKNSTRRMRLTIGQTVVGYALGDNYNSNFGFWSGLNVAPLPPVVVATQGDLLDRIQISWSINPLGAFPTNGFKIYRDGVFLVAVDKNTRNYNDFNVIAGKNYTYEVRAVNLYGEGSAGEALGFQVPNGVVTGWVRTLNGNPVPGAQVTLSPMQGYSAQFNQFDGAVTRAGAGNHFLPTAVNTDWSLTFWMRTTAVTGQVGTSDILRVSGPHLNVRTNGGGLVSMEIPGTTPGSIQSIGTLLPNGNDGSWHHVALTFGGGQYRLYLNGTLVELKNGVHIPESSEINFGANNPFPGWVGGMDELRIYHRRLEELELQEVMTGTASSLTPGLKYYWKMDEGAGKKSFDILNRHPLFFCGAIFDANRPPVATSAVTNDDGYYRIESANYGTGTTFLATPKKDFYKHRALKFLKNEGDYAQLPDFALTEKSTLEMWVYQSDPSATEVFLQKAWGPGGGNFFMLQTHQNAILVNLNGETADFGPLGFGYQHLALTIERNPSNTAITVYKNGVLLGSHNFSPTSGDWSEPGFPWNVGALSGLYGVPAGQFGYFYDGLIDELAVYDTTLSQAAIQAHSQNARDPQEKGLRHYFAFDEGSGFKLNNAGSALIDGTGTTYGTEWTVQARFQETTPHQFTPDTRQVTLNPSVTSVDQVDFVDRSTVAVSGFIRYANTDCFANQFEILVNGETYNPTVLTDSTGKFVIDFEPGSTVTLRPVYKDHEFMPEEIDLVNVIAPVAGLVFNDITTRTVSGQVAGGDCKRSILENPGTPTGTVCTVKVRTTDGCFEKQVTLDNPQGNYELADLPPLEFTVAVTEHSDPLIKTAFQVQGGVQVDLREKQDTVVDFTYYAPPEVEVVSGLSPISQTCDIIKLEQHELRTIGIKVKETYYNNEVCYLDTAALQIINGFADTVVNTTLSQGIRNYKFKVGQPNPTSPHEKTIQIIATNLAGNESSFTKQGVVTGIRNKHNTFTSKTPQTPLLVLHDPPGDGSYSFLEKDQTVCKRTTMEFEFETGAGFGLDIWLGPEISVSLGIGVEYVSTTGIILEGGFEAQATHHKIDSKTYETCTTFSERVTTGDNQLVVGDQGGDVFVGQAMNFEFGFADLVYVNDTTCTASTKTVLNVEPDSFQTTFYYSEWGIRENVIRYLDSLRVNDATSAADSLTYANSANLWRKILDDNRNTKTARRFIRKISRLMPALLTNTL